jgi:hypothetical protein
MSLQPWHMQALRRLDQLEKKHEPVVGFFAGKIGKAHARALRQLDGSPWVRIDKQAQNSFRYYLTDAGRELVSVRS